MAGQNFTKRGAGESVKNQRARFDQTKKKCPVLPVTWEIGRRNDRTRENTRGTVTRRGTHKEGELLRTRRGASIAMDVSEMVQREGGGEKEIKS